MMLFPVRLDQPKPKDIYEPEMLEALEDRITPASFFVGADGGVLDPHGQAVEQYDDNDSADWSTALTKTGADSAFLFKKGDTLGFDSNGNGKLDKGETVLLKLTGGAAVFFLSGTGDALAIKGVAASDKFGGTINGVVGEIVTNLVKQGSGKTELYDFTDTIQDADIRGLKINGYVQGESGIVAGGSVSALNITGAAEATNVSAWRLAAGGSSTNSAKIGELSFFGYSESPGQLGPSVSKVSSLGGIMTISAGSGGSALDQSKAPAGKGGSVFDIKMGAGGTDFSIEAGNGGSGDLGKGGSGGDLKNIFISGLSGQNISMLAGTGDMGTTEVGKGGSISGIKLTGDSAANIQIRSGNGEGNIHGGATGGSISNITSEVTHIDRFEILAGHGGRGYLGESSTGGSGGAGGSIVDILLMTREEAQAETYVSKYSIDILHIEAGAGGDGAGSGNGGQGGSIKEVYAPVTTALGVLAGFGGSAEDHGDSSRKFGKAGAGGDIVHVLSFAQAGGENAPDFVLSAGDSGAGAKTPGGDINGAIIASRTQGAGTIQIIAGNGSMALENSAQAGGAGGNLNLAAIFLPKIETAVLASGSGGNGQFAEFASSSIIPGGAGGAGGKVNAVYVLSYDAGQVGIYGGYGGHGAGKGSGGNGGSVNDLILSGMVTDEGPQPGVFSYVEIYAGNGGWANAPQDMVVNGGNGGNLTNVSGPTFNTFDELYLDVGYGGQGSREGIFGKTGNHKNLFIG